MHPASIRSHFIELGTMSQTRHITKRQVPVFLQGGKLFATLADEDSLIEVRDDVFKTHAWMGDAAGMKHILNCLQFWAVDDLPPEAFQFWLEEHLDPAQRVEILAEYAEVFPVLCVLEKIRLSSAKSKISIAIDSGNAGLLQWMLKNGHRFGKADSLTVAEAGNLQLLTAIQKYSWLDHATPYSAIKGDHVSCLEFALDHDCPLDDAMLEYAAKCGSLKCLQYLYEEEGLPLRAQVALSAAGAGHLACLQYLHEQGCVWGPALTKLAAQEGRLECLQYAHQHGCRFTEDAVLSAVRGGHEHCLQYFHQQGFQWKMSVTRMAADRGHFECLSYALRNGCECAPDAAELAARSGNVDCLRELFVAGIELIEHIAAAAAAGGHLDCLQCLNELGCPWDESTTYNAVNKSDPQDRAAGLECLQYAHENDCPWNEDVARVAAESGNIEGLTYLFEHGCPWNEEAPRAAAAAGMIDTLQFLHENGCPWDARMCSEAARGGHLACLQYAHEHGCPWDAETIHSACRERKWECLQYAYEQGCRGDDEVCRREVRGSALPDVENYADEHKFQWLYDLCFD